MEERIAKDIITECIRRHYEKNNGIGDKTLDEIYDELVLIYHIRLDKRVLDARIKEFMGNKFSSK
jgi:hypothetical protein